MSPTKGPLKVDFPSAKFWVKIFFGWVPEPTTPPPSYKRSLIGTDAQRIPDTAPPPPPHPPPV